MHDVGKLGVPDSILLKRGPLTPEERIQMEHHAEAGFGILKDSRSRPIQLAAEIALSHHEKWDGTGYPRRLKGADIPLAGRCVRNGATVISPTGKAFTDDSIGMAVATRDLLTSLRSAGMATRGPPPLTRQDKSRFLSALDLAVTRKSREPG